MEKLGIHIVDLMSLHCCPFKFYVPILSDQNCAQDGKLQTKPIIYMPIIDAILFIDLSHSSLIFHTGNLRGRSHIKGKHLYPHQPYTVPIYTVMHYIAVQWMCHLNASQMSTVSATLFTGIFVMPSSLIYAMSSIESLWAFAACISMLALNQPH